MKIILPVKITESMVTGNTIPAETGIPIYSKTTTYSSGQKCISHLDGIPHIFGWYPPVEDSEAKSVGVDPATKYVLRKEKMNINAASVDAAYKRYWLALGPVNNLAMFDQRSAISSTSPDTITVKIKADEMITAVALVNITGADHVSVTVTDDVEGVVYSHDESLINLADIIDFWAWFFLPPDNRTEFFLTDIPAYVGAEISITLSNEAGEAIGIGEIIVGSVVEIGTLTYGASSEYKTWQYKVLDESGRAAIRKSMTKQVTSYGLNVKTDRLDYAKRMLQKVAGVPTVFIGTEEHTVTSVYGVYEQFSVVLAGYTKSACSLSVEEMTHAID